MNYYPKYLHHSGAIIWLKKEGGPLSDAEIAWQSLSKVVSVYKHNWRGFQKESSDLGVERVHPNQKPVNLYFWTLKNYAKEGDSILDTHLGSGSSRIAAHDMGFDLVGYEIDKDYFDAQEKRFTNHIKQGSLFSPKDMYQ